jgi:hypothetical protein
MPKLIPTVAVIGAVLVVGGIASSGDTDTSEPRAEAQSSASSPKAKPTKPAEPAEPAEPELTAGQSNALDAAQNYIDILPLSKEGLADQLKFEGYVAKDVTFAVANVDADWFDEAEEAALAYQDAMPMSRTALIDQLEFEGFTAREAAHGVKATGL